MGKAPPRRPARVPGGSAGGSKGLSRGGSAGGALNPPPKQGILKAHAERSGPPRLRRGAGARRAARPRQPIPGRMIELHALSRSVSMGGRTLTILHPLSLAIPRGQFVAVMGPSGSGKSTLLGLMAGLDAPSGGRIAIAGQVLTGMDEDALARFRGRHIGFVFQSFQLIPTLTARENVQVPLEIRRDAAAAPRAAELLEQVGLTARAEHYPAQLSGGEQQRVAIARAFACRPPVLLADEPTGNLDSRTGAQIIALLKRLHADEGATLVLVTHDPEIAAAAERTIQLLDGRVVHDSAPAQAGRAAPALAAG
jgi:putative ABC transport system ATP-binding protein